MPDIAVVVRDLHKEFVLPQHRRTSLKQVFVSFWKRHPKVQQKVLDGIDFEVKKGDFFGIVGRNGSGKSTLLKILAGVYAPTAGVVETYGALTPFIELGVGFNPELSGRDNVFLNGALLGFSRREMNAMYDDIVEFAELHEFMDKKLKNYSSGMQVRLAFSIAVKAKNEILIFDEVLAVGDAAFQQKCFDYFEKLKTEKQTVIFVSHDMSAVRRFCNQAIYLKEGKIIGSGSPDEVADIYTVENIQDAASNPESTPGDKLSAGHTLSAKIVDRDDKRLTIELSYKANDAQDMYIGLSVQRQGVSIAEITTPESILLKRNGSILYDLDLELFNPGTYQIGGGLFLHKNRELVAISEANCNFAIKGSDPTKGGALRLKHEWRTE
jgi:ABC-2 type transport system ATP-binding protein